MRAVTFVLTALGLACANESATSVPGVAVRVSPDSADVVAGQELLMTAEVLNLLGRPFEGLTPEWRSEDTSIATVDSQGSVRVRGRGEGVVEIRASVPGAEDVARVRVLPHPRIALSEPRVAWAVGAGGPAPPARAVAISNGGAGTLGTLELTVRHDPESPQWLAAELTSATEPTAIALTVETAGLDAGTHEATVLVTSDSTGVQPVEVPVALTLTDFSLTETSDLTVSEGSDADTVLVVLRSPPTAAVVLSVGVSGTAASASPERLGFTPEDWATPRPVAVTGVDDIAVDGEEVSELSFAVDTAASDSAFHGIPAKALRVVTLDDDRPGLVVTETGDGTRVGEAGGTDDFRVALAAQPLSDVRLTVASEAPTEVAAAPSFLRFTPGDWAAPQVVTVRAVADGITDGPQTSNVTLAIDPAASDDAFADLSSFTVAVTTLDADTSGVHEGSPTGHPDVSSAGLVAAYNMTTLNGQGLLRDFSGRNLNGSISGTSVVASPRGGARLFQVAADRIELPARSDFDLDGPLTLVARFRLDVSSRHQHVLACDDKFALAVREADQVRLSNTRGDLAETLEPLPTGDWHTVIGVFRGTVGDALDDTNVEIWIDGVRAPIQVGSGTGAVPPVWRDGVLHATDACYIGFESHQGDPSHQNLAFHGAIDEILVFGRALTPEEVLSLSEAP